MRTWRACARSPREGRRAWMIADATGPTSPGARGRRGRRCAWRPAACTASTAASAGARILRTSAGPACWRRGGSTRPDEPRRRSLLDLRGSALADLPHRHPYAPQRQRRPPRRDELGDLRRVVPARVRDRIGWRGEVGVERVHAGRGDAEQRLDLADRQRQLISIHVNSMVPTVEVVEVLQTLHAAIAVRKREQRCGRCALPTGRRIAGREQAERQLQIGSEMSDTRRRPAAYKEAAAYLGVPEGTLRCLVSRRQV